MGSLPDNCIDLIYIDPPFNTKRKDLGYSDSFRTTDAFVQFLSFRLAECYRLLKSTGVLCVHLDYRTVHYIKVALDRIFGERNFINEIVWRRGRVFSNTKGSFFPRNHDSILVCTKSNNYKYERQIRPYSQNSIKRYYLDDNDGRGRYLITNLRSYSNDSIKELAKDGRIGFFKNGKRGLKLYLKETMGMAVDSFWDDIPAMASNGKERTGYDTQKPLKLLERLIKAFTHEGDLVADFFCGSGTTLVAAKQLSRKYLGCDISKEAVKITEKRLKDARN